MRHIRQIAALPEGDRVYPAIVALCDDGTVWITAVVGQEWTKVTDIPQDETEA